VSGTTTRLKPIWVEVAPTAKNAIERGQEAQLLRDTACRVRDARRDHEATSGYDAPVDAIRFVAQVDDVAVFELDVSGPNMLTVRVIAYEWRLAGYALRPDDVNLSPADEQEVLHARLQGAAPGFPKPLITKQRALELAHELAEWAHSLPEETTSEETRA
jgi:hypothetical protein